MAWLLLVQVLLLLASANGLLPTFDVLRNSRFIRSQDNTRALRTNIGSSRASVLNMGMQVTIRIVGRKNGSEKWLEDAYQMYDTRLRPSNVEVKTIWHKNDNDLLKGVSTDTSKGHSIVLLDPTGKTQTSEQFSEDMYKMLDTGGSRLAFVIGGAPGLPPELRDSGTQMLSLSALTFTHQFARTLLIEQIYRASEIRKGSGYHK